jgi:hypothetical protein
LGFDISGHLGLGETDGYGQGGDQAAGVSCAMQLELLFLMRVILVGDQVLHRCVDLFPYAQLRRAADTVIGRVGLALVLGKREERGVPTVGVQPRRFIELPM